MICLFLRAVRDLVADYVSMFQAAPLDVLGTPLADAEEDIEVWGPVGEWPDIPPMTTTAASPDSGGLQPGAASLPPTGSGLPPKASA